MAEETNPANPDETKTQGDAADDQPAAKEATPKAEAAVKRPVCPVRGILKACRGDVE